MPLERREFLRLFGLGVPAAAVAGRLGLFDRARSYFFAPLGGWGSIVLPAQKLVTPTIEQCIALQLEKVRHRIPLLYHREEVLLSLMDRDQREAWDNVRMRIPATALYNA